MNAQDYHNELNVLLRAAARSLCAHELLAGLISQTAQIACLSSMQENSDFVQIVEVIRHELDVAVVNYRKHHARPTA